MFETKSGFIFRADRKYYQVYKSSLAFWLVVSWLFGVADAWLNPVEGRYYLDYLSNYNEMVAVAWTIIHAYISIKRETSEFIQATGRILQCVSWLCSVNVALCYYGTQGVKNADFCTYRSIHQHLLLALINFFDMIVTEITPRWYDVLFVNFFNFHYLFVTLLIMHQGRSAVYLYWDFQNDYNTAIKICFICGAVIPMIFFLAMIGICRLRNYFSRNCTMNSKNELCVSFLDDRNDEGQHMKKDLI